MMTVTTDPRVDVYIAALPAWQQAIGREVRALVHAADPEVTETIKRRTQPYFVLQGNICALLATKDHVNVFLYDGGLVPDPDGIINGGHTNITARTGATRQGEPINALALSTLFQQIVANNRAGGRRTRVAMLVRKTVCIQALTDLERRLQLVFAHQNLHCQQRLEKLGWLNLSTH